MNSLIQYLSMGGYAAWVWPAYGLATLGLVGMLVFSLQTLKKRQREFDELRSLRRDAEED